MTDVTATEKNLRMLAADLRTKANDLAGAAERMEAVADIIQHLREESYLKRLQAVSADGQDSIARGLKK